MRYIKRVPDSGNAGQLRGGRGRHAWTSVMLLMLVAAGSWLAAANQNSKFSSDEKKKHAYEYALLFGTVFDDTGRLVRRAQVHVREKEGKRRWEATADGRGEFAVRLPTVPAVYVVEATAPGFTRDTKEIRLAADERKNVVMHISRQGK